MSKVLVADSTYETCREAVDRAFSAFPVKVRGKKVAVKVNALKAGDPDRQAFVTHYKLVEAVVEKLASFRPAQIVVGDSVGTESYGNSDRVFDVTHLKKAAGPYYRNFSKSLKVVQLDRPFKRKVAVLKDVLEADVYLSHAEDENPRLDHPQRFGEEQFRTFGGSSKVLVSLFLRQAGNLRLDCR